MTKARQERIAWEHDFQGKQCTCGRQASRYVCGDKVCAVCAGNTDAKKAHSIRKKLPGFREPKSKSVMKYDERPEVFTPSVQFSSDKLVIDAHGHYEFVL